MAVATATYQEKTDEQQAITEMVRQFVDKEILPVAEEFDHEDKFPEAIVEQMKELGLFGVTIPEEYGGMGLDLTTYAMIVEELSRGWISISGVVNTHFIGSYLLMKFGTDEQKDKYLPKMATGEIRGAFSLSEPEVGSDVQGIKSTAKEVDGGWEINGQKMWVTNGLGSGLVFVLVKTRPEGRPALQGDDLLHLREGAWASRTTAFAGLEIPPKIKKMGYKGVESTELVYDGFEVTDDRILGGARRPRPGLQADDGRARARPRQRRRARRRRRPARARAGAALQPGAQDVRQADRPAPGDHVQARRDGHPARGGAAADDEGGADEGRRRALRHRGRDGEAVRLRDRQGERRGVRFASTAATATRRSTRSSASTATRRCC